mgnify:CR=1 FL=1
MTHYVDIKILNVIEISSAFVLNTVFGRLHNELAMNEMDCVGVSFPELDEKHHSLGCCLRVHGSSRDLEQLFSHPWLASLRDYVKLGEFWEVPQGVKHRVVSRVQTKSNPERLRRRLMKRHGITEAEARERIPDTAVKMSSLPFINMKSSSTGQRFKLFIENGPVLDSPVAGHFSAYGLSPTATIPWF